MLIVVLVIVWIAVLAPVAIRKFRDQDTDRSILNFHQRMAHLGRGRKIVEPAHRLAVNDEPAPLVTAAPRPLLRVVGADEHEDASWEEWSRQQGDDRPSHSEAVATTPRYQTAYAHVPVEAAEPYVPVRSNFGSRSQRVRRRRVLFSLAGSTALSTIVALITSSLIVDAWTMLSWVALLGFLGLMYYAMSTGMLNVPVATQRFVTPRTRHSTGRHVAYEDNYDALDEPQPWASSYDDEAYAQAL